MEEFIYNLAHKVGNSTPQKRIKYLLIASICGWTVFLTMPGGNDNFASNFFVGMFSVVSTALCVLFFIFLVVDLRSK